MVAAYGGGGTKLSAGDTDGIRLGDGQRGGSGTADSIGDGNRIIAGADAVEVLGAIEDIIVPIEIEGAAAVVDDQGDGAVAAAVAGDVGAGNIEADVTDGGINREGAGLLAAVIVGDGQAIVAGG